MNKTEFVKAVAETAGIKRDDADKAIKAFEQVITEALKSGDKVQLTGFGSFEVAERAERTGKNPRTGEAIAIPAGKSPKFKAGKAFKDAVNG